VPGQVGRAALRLLPLLAAPGCRWSGWLPCGDGGELELEARPLEGPAA
jgi:hypothetical protein